MSCMTFNSDCSYFYFCAFISLILCSTGIIMIIGNFGDPCLRSQGVSMLLTIITLWCEKPKFKEKKYEFSSPHSFRNSEKKEEH